METGNSLSNTREPWNKGKLVGQKSPFKLKDLGHPHPFADGKPMPGIGTLQLGDR